MLLPKRFDFAILFEDPVYGTSGNREIEVFFDSYWSPRRELVSMQENLIFDMLRGFMGNSMGSAGLILQPLGPIPFVLPFPVPDSVPCGAKDPGSSRDIEFYGIEDHFNADIKWV
jgi:hypothetical protein